MQPGLGKGLYWSVNVVRARTRDCVGVWLHLWHRSQPNACSIVTSS